MQRLKSPRHYSFRNRRHNDMDRRTNARPTGRLHFKKCVTPPILYWPAVNPIFYPSATPTLKTRLGQKPKSSGAPTLLFLTSAALRVADVCRILKDKRLRGEKGGEVAKLMAKHIKFDQHVVYLRRTKIGAAAGTPGRIGKLLEHGGSSPFPQPRVCD